MPMGISPQHCATGQQCGVVHTRSTGAPPERPPTPTYHKDSLQTKRVLQSVLIQVLELSWRADSRKLSWKANSCLE